MLLVVAESAGRTQTLAEVARELSLKPSFFDNAESLQELMQGHYRRIILFGENDVCEDTLKVIDDADGRTPFGLIICTDREALRLSKRATLLDRVAEYTNVEWLRADYDFDALYRAARECRRRMLRISKRELEHALLGRQFVIQYQPKVDRGTGEEWVTREAEALLRWKHPEHGVLGPLEFLPEVEAFDLIGPISEFVLHEAAAQLLRWQEQGLNLNSCINLAPSLLRDPQLPETYAGIIADHGLECSRFTFEVAEQDVKDSDAPHLKILGALRERGVRISLDDFSAAASSLRTFEQLPVDEIKIHAAALNRARNNEVAQKVLAAVTGLAHNLGISVCAEGVEDVETFEFLKTIQCDKMQGFLISEAVMPDIIRRVYTSRGNDVEDVA